METTRKSSFYTNIDLPSDFAISTRDGLHILDDRPVESLEYHDILEVGHCHNGSGFFFIGDKILPFSAGDVSVIAPGELHLAQSERGTTSSWTFLFVDIDRLLVPAFPELADFDIHRYSGPSFKNVISPQAHPGMNAIVRSLIREARYRRRHYRTMMLSYLAVLAAILERDFESSSSRSANMATRTSIKQVQLALEYIAQHYYEPILVTHLARLCNMSQRNFSRRFVQALKRPPHEYIAETRIAVACGYLLRGGSTISQLAERCGFVSISSFNRTFKEKMGMSPSEWRKRGSGSRVAASAQFDSIPAQAFGPK